MVKRKRKNRLRRGIFLLPSLLTLSSMLAGFYSIIQSVKYYSTRDVLCLRSACLAILLSMILDGLDGRVARLTDTQSDFGAQLDSLSDMISFGFAPGFLIYYSCLDVVTLGRLTWVICFTLPACAALRLARFNSQDENLNKVFFRGLPSPMGAGVIACYFWLISVLPWMQQAFYFWVGLVLSVPIGLLEVSRLRYRSFKNFDVRGKVPFFVLLILFGFLALVILFPALVLCVTFSIYALSGPVSYFFVRFIRGDKLN
jgi:CDP-diacylglycerol---serine O-phosphatidyltransferase